MTAPQIPPVKVDIVAGQNTAIPALQRTGSEIARVAAGATGGLSPVQRLGKALALSEAREGSTALRLIRGGINEVALSATGAAGPLGRVLEGALGLAGGGEVALAVAAGVAAIAAGYKLLGGEASAAAAETRKLKQAVLESAAKTPEHQQVVRGRTTPVAAQEIASEEAKLAPLHEAFNRAVRESQAPLVALAGTQKEHAAQVERARQAYADQVEKVRELKGVLLDLQHPGAIATVVVSPDYELLRKRHEDELRTTPAERVEADQYRRAALGQAGNVPAMQGLTEAGTTPEANTVRGVQTSDRGSRWDPGPPSPRRDDDRELAAEIGRSLSAALAVVAGVRRGDAGSVISGIGGATSALSQLQRTDEAGKAVSLIPGLGTASTVISAVGSLATLFGSGKAKVTISDLEDEAVRKLKEVMQLPANVSATFANVPAGTDIRQIKQDLDRLAAKTGVVTLPGMP